MNQNSINLKISLTSDGLQQLNMLSHESKENSSLNSNQAYIIRKSCPLTTTGLSNGSIATAGRYSCNSKDSFADSSRSSSNAFKGDRFIPFRGTQDNFGFEEFIMNNDPYKEQKKKPKSSEESSTRINE